MNSERTIQCSVQPKKRIAVAYRNLADLRPDPKNARLHSKRQIAQLTKSIEAFDFNVPILIDEQDNVIAGHGRILACKKLGWTEVPTICLSHLTAAQTRAFMIADNRLAEIAVWNEKLLAEQLKDLSLLDLDFSLDATGFELAEIDFRIQALSIDSSEEKADAADELPAPSSAAVTGLGDIWQLGPHRVFCGNALDAESYTCLMQDKVAAMAFTDPPYNVAITGHVCGKGSIQHREFAMASGEMSEAEFILFLTAALLLMAQFSGPGSIHFQCMDWRHMAEMRTAGKAAYSELKNLCVWAKDTAGMGSFYRSQHELVFVFKNGNSPHINNIQLGKFGRNRTNIWRFPGVNSFARNNEEGNLLEIHPTCKPVRLVADAMLDCSNRGDIILDPFLGSGTTVMAAERTGRLCYGMELDPLYVDTIIRRWQRYTGGVAVHAVTGQAFADREANVSSVTTNAEVQHEE